MSKSRLLAELTTGFYLLLSTPANATLPARPTETICPLTNEVITFVGEYGSFTSFGISLDFEPLVMGMLRRSPSLVPQCRDTGFPVYREFSPPEIVKIRNLVVTQDWKEHRAISNVPYLVAYVKDILKEDQRSIAYSLLMSVWSSTQENRAFLVGKAAEMWTLIADEDHPHDRDWVIANWLSVDLNRQRGMFKQADLRLQNFLQKTDTSYAPISVSMISLERQLISDRNSEPAAVPRDPMEK